MLTPQGEPDGVAPVLLSVLMPCRNAAPFIERTLQSLATQGGDDWELVVQDACSHDGTLEVLAQFADAHPGRVAVVSERDDGQADALNRALRKAAGSYVVWLNADDLLAPGAFDAIRASLAAHDGVDVVYGDWSIVDADDHTIRDNVVGAWSRERFFAKGNYVFSGAVVMRQALIEEIGGWDSSLHFCMDLDWCLRVPRQARAVHAGAALASLRWHAAAKSSASGWSFVRESAQVRLRHRQGPGELVTTAKAGLVLAASTATSDFRYGPLFSRWRGTKRF